jgi:hypothetical protein
MTQKSHSYSDRDAVKHFLSVIDHREAGAWDIGKGGIPFLGIIREYLCNKH